MSEQTEKLNFSARQVEIIEAAGKILTTSGVNGLTIKNLAKEMQFSEGAIYRHFASKEAIVVAMLGYLADVLTTNYQQVVVASNTPEENLKALFTWRLEYFNTNPHFLVAVFSDGLVDESETVNKAISELMATTSSFLKPILLEGQRKGVFTSTLSIDELAHVIMGTLRLQMLKWKLSKFSFNFLENGHSLLSSLLALIKTH